MPARTVKVSPHEAGSKKGKAAKLTRARKSIMKPGCVVISSEHPISDQALYEAIHGH